MNNLRYADDTTLMAESKEELNSLLMTVKEESEKDGSEKDSQDGICKVVLYTVYFVKHWNQFEIAVDESISFDLFYILFLILKSWVNLCGSGFLH